VNSASASPARDIVATRASSTGRRTIPIELGAIPIERSAIPIELGAILTERSAAVPDLDAAQLGTPRCADHGASYSRRRVERQRTAARDV
jgi:hypothetical protein